MAKRKGMVLELLPTIERPKGGHSILNRKLIRPKVGKNIVVHRRGIRRTDYNPKTKEQWYETMAVPKSDARYGKGPVTERIFLKKLLDRHLVDGIDFIYQSSLKGGRVDLGGMVADFELVRPKVIIRVQGQHWHGEFDRTTGQLMFGDLVQARKDDVQGGTLSDMGYDVVDLWEYVCYEPYLLEAFCQRWVDASMVGMQSRF